MNDDLVVQKILKLLENNTAFIGYALNGGIGTKINVRNTETGKTIQALSINVDSSGEVLVVKDSDDGKYKAVTFKAAQQTTERIIQIRKTKPIDEIVPIKQKTFNIKTLYNVNFQEITEHPGFTWREVWIGGTWPAKKVYTVPEDYNMLDSYIVNTGEKEKDYTILIRLLPTGINVFNSNSLRRDLKETNSNFNETFEANPMKLIIIERTKTEEILFPFSGGECHAFFWKYCAGGFYYTLGSSEGVRSPYSNNLNRVIDVSNYAGSTRYANSTVNFAGSAEFFTYDLPYIYTTQTGNADPNQVSWGNTLSYPNAYVSKYTYSPQSSSIGKLAYQTVLINGVETIQLPLECLDENGVPFYAPHPNTHQNSFFIHGYVGFFNENSNTQIPLIGSLSGKNVSSKWYYKTKQIETSIYNLSYLAVTGSTNRDFSMTGNFCVMPNKNYEFNYSVKITIPLGYSNSSGFYYQPLILDNIKNDHALMLKIEGQGDLGYVTEKPVAKFVVIEGDQEIQYNRQILGIPAFAEGDYYYNADYIKTASLTFEIIGYSWKKKGGIPVGTSAQEQLNIEGYFISELLRNNDVYFSSSFGVGITNIFVLTHILKSLCHFYKNKVFCFYGVVDINGQFFANEGMNGKEVDFVSENIQSLPNRTSFPLQKNNFNNSKVKAKILILEFNPETQRISLNPKRISIPVYAPSYEITGSTSIALMSADFWEIVLAKYNELPEYIVS